MNKLFCCNVHVFYFQRVVKILNFNTEVDQNITNNTVYGNKLKYQIFIYLNNKMNYMGIKNNK